jgi:hypothetical protein
MRKPTFIDDEEVIEKILKHLGLWDLKVKQQPKVKASSIRISIDDSDSQVPFSTPPFYPDPNTRWIPTDFQKSAEWYQEWYQLLLFLL